MKVFLYSGMQKMIEKSGVGRAIYHQKKAAAFNDIELVDNLLIHRGRVLQYKHNPP